MVGTLLIWFNVGLVVVYGGEVLNLRFL